MKLDNPLHPPGQLEKRREPHLPQIHAPMPVEEGLVAAGIDGRLAPPPTSINLVARPVALAAREHPASPDSGRGCLFLECGAGAA